MSTMSSMSGGSKTPSGPGPSRRMRLRCVAAWSCVLLCCAIAPLTGAGARLSVKSMVRRTPQVESLLATGRIQILEEYPDGGARQARGSTGALILIAGAEADVSAAENASGGAGRRRVQNAVHLRSRTIDTEGGLTQPTASTGKGRLEIIQFHGPIKKGWLDTLRSKGMARPVAYLPDNAYVVWAENPSRLTAAGLPLQWREELGSKDRLSPELKSPTGPVDVTLQLVRAGAHDAVLDEIRSRAIAVLMEPHDFGEVMHIRVTLPPESIEALAARPEVLWMEPFEAPVAHDERTTMVVAGQVASSPTGSG